jgi:predicted nucleic acid-binding protein
VTPRGLLDTSVLIAREQHREIDAAALPDEAAISVVTLAELGVGVHLAAPGQTRAQRLATLVAARSTYVALPVSSEVAADFAELVAAAHQAGKRPKIQDAWIAATARVNGVPVYTQDSDFDELPGVEVVRV